MFSGERYENKDGDKERMRNRESAWMEGKKRKMRGVLPKGQK